jgi:hypothetical protein
MINDLIISDKVVTMGLDNVNDHEIFTNEKDDLISSYKDIICYVYFKNELGSFLSI